MRFSVDSAEQGLKSLMRVFPQGVTIITTKRGERLYGITISAFTSVSLKPPLVLVSVSKETPTHAALADEESFTVNILSSEQASLSEKFAGRSAGTTDKFHETKFRKGENGCPILEGALGFLECKRRSSYDGGDHTIILGEVTNADLRSGELPLVYYNRQYTTVLLPTLEKSSYESLLGEW